MLGEQMNVRLDRHRCSVGRTKMRWHSRLHDEERMKPDQHVGRAGDREARCFAIERTEDREVLVDQDRADQSIRAGSSPESLTSASASPS